MLACGFVHCRDKMKVTNWNWQGDRGLPLTASSVTACAVPPSPEGKVLKSVPLAIPLHSRHPYVQATSAAARPQKEQCGDFAEGFFRFGGNSKNPSAIEPPRMQPPLRLLRRTEGVRGEAVFASPRRLCARGSMTLRRAKVALKLQCSIAPEDKQSRDYVQRMPSHPLTRELSQRESLWHCQFQFTDIKRSSRYKNPYPDTMLPAPYPFPGQRSSCRT